MLILKDLERKLTKWQKEVTHVLGLGDLYRINHGNNANPATFEGEDFVDHGLPSGPLPDTRTKRDDVMQRRGITVLDNDSIHGAEWLWGNSGSNGIVTGELQKRTGINNANRAANHHGLTQTAKTWTYRGTVAFFSGAPKVTLFFSGIQAARDVGPGNWTPTIFANRVEFDSAGAWEGNFKFELDCDQRPERLGDATVAGVGATNFTAAPAGGGPQLFPFAQVYGADCEEGGDDDDEDEEGGEHRVWDFVWSEFTADWFPGVWTLDGQPMSSCTTFPGGVVTGPNGLYRPPAV